MKTLENVYVKETMYGRKASIKQNELYYNINVDVELPIEDGFYTIEADRIWFSEANGKYTSKYFARDNVKFIYSPKNLIK